MPIYEFECPECGYVVEQSVDHGVTHIAGCPACRSLFVMNRLGGSNHGITRRPERCS